MGRKEFTRNVETTTNTNVDVKQSGAVSTATLSSVTSGQDSTTSASTSTALNGGASLTVPDGATLRVKALSGNGGAVYVGDSTVSTGSGYELGAGEAVYLAVDDVSDVSIVDGSGGYGVSWVVEQ